MGCWLHRRGESALRKRQRGDQWWGIRGTGPILGAGNSELLITVALLNHHHHDHIVQLVLGYQKQQPCVER